MFRERKRGREREKESKRDRERMRERKACLSGVGASPALWGRGAGCLIPLFHTGPESHELTRIDKYSDSWLNRSQFVKILTDSHSP